MRVAVNYAVFAFLWSLLSYLHLLTNLRYVSVHLTVLAVLVGVLVGAVSGFAVAKRQLTFLTKNGETRVPLWTILFLIGGLFIFISFLFFLAYNAPIGTLATAITFLCPFLPAYSAAEAIMFLRWERKHKKQIIAGMWNRFYVSPEAD
jgi:hypothetical protein